jgi:N-acetylneuraminate synthase
MCGGPGTDKRIPSIAEVEYLDALVRGVYVKRDLPAGHQLTDNDVYLAVPLLKGQLSCRELISGEAISQAISADQPLTLDFLDNPYSRNTQLREQIEKRGL